MGTEENWEKKLRQAKAEIDKEFKSFGEWVVRYQMNGVRKKEEILEELGKTEERIKTQKQNTNVFEPYDLTKAPLTGTSGEIVGYGKERKDKKREIFREADLRIEAIKDLLDDVYGK